MFLTGHRDTDLLVVDRLASWDLIRLSASVKLSIFQKRQFWLQQLKKRFKGYEPITDLHPRQIILKILTYRAAGRGTEEGSAFSLAAGDGDLESVHFFHQKDSWTYFPITNAIDNNQIEVLKYFLRKHEKIHIYLYDHACYKKNLEVIDLFLEHANSNNKTRMLVYCIKTGDISLVKHLLNRGCVINNFVLIQAVYSENKEMVNFCIELGLNNWHEALEASVENCDLDLVKFFLNKLDNKRQHIIDNLDFVEELLNYPLDVLNLDKIKEIREYLGSLL